MNVQSDLTGYTASFIDSLYKAGINKVVISPGSRSTPLAMMFHAHPKIESWINVDERSAGFFALGMAKGLHAPVALLCSSGTAAANYFPAIIEARYGRVPLIVLTADRPHELRGVGAPQTIDQIKLYGDHVKWHQDMPIPDQNERLNDFLAASARRAVSVAIDAPQGPVHLNFPFREPLVPDVDRRNLWDGSNSGDQLISGKLTLSADRLEHIAKVWESIQKPLIVVGSHQDNELSAAVIALAKSLNAPIIADPLSGLRTGDFDQDLIIDGYDAFLRSQTLKRELQTDGVIRFGAMPVSKPFLKYLESMKPQQYLVIDESGVWRDPTHLATHHIKADALSFSKGLVAAVNRVGRKTNDKWLGQWQEINQTTTEIISNFTENSDWFEGHVVDILLKHLEDHAAIFVGNSMPIRDMDTFLLNNDHPIEVYANRGANGIDGVVSSAIGVSTVKKPTYLLIGDLSFFHDMNGLMAAKLYELDITIIVVNNNGGGIFSFLSQAKEKEETFETLFGTPLNIDIKSVAQLYKGVYKKAVDKRTFEQAILEVKDQPGLKIIEAVTTRKENVAKHQHLWEEVLDAIERKLGVEHQ